MKTKRIVITGGPGTGKTTIIAYLEKKGYACFPEVSRSVTKKAQGEGIDQLFLSDPILFSESLLNARTKQFDEAAIHYSKNVFYDRGLPDITGYLNYLGKGYSKEFDEICFAKKYDLVFILPPWKAIYVQDSERYETYEQASSIYQFLLKSYQYYKYQPIEVPLGTLEARSTFILETLSKI